MQTGTLPDRLDLFRKMEGQNFLHSIVVYTHVHRFSLRLTPVKGPLITQWPVTVILDGSLVISESNNFHEGKSTAYCFSLLATYTESLQTTNIQQLSILPDCP